MHPPWLQQGATLISASSASPDPLQSRVAWCRYHALYCRIQQSPLARNIPAAASAAAGPKQQPRRSSLRRACASTLCSSLRALSPSLFAAPTEGAQRRQLPVGYPGRSNLRAPLLNWRGSSVAALRTSARASLNAPWSGPLHRRWPHALLTRAAPFLAASSSRETVPLLVLGGSGHASSQAAPLATAPQQRLRASLARASPTPSAPRGLHGLAERPWPPRLPAEGSSLWTASPQGSRSLRGLSVEEEKRRKRAHSLPSQRCSHTTAPPPARGGHTTRPLTSQCDQRSRHRSRKRRRRRPSQLQPRRARRESSGKALLLGGDGARRGSRFCRSERGIVVLENKRCQDMRDARKDSRRPHFQHCTFHTNKKSIE
jgi:hypothetical protein